MIGVEKPEVPMLMINSLCLILAISIGLYMHKRKNPQSNLLGDIKNALSAGLPYTIVISIFIYLFYTYIDPGYTEHKISERITAAEKYIANEDNWNKIKANPTYETFSKEQFLKAEMESATTFNSPKFVMIVSLLGGLLLGTFYSIFVSVIYRKVMFKEQTEALKKMNQ